MQRKRYSKNSRMISKNDIQELKFTIDNDVFMYGLRFPSLEKMLVWYQCSHVDQMMIMSGFLAGLSPEFIRNNQIVYQIITTHQYKVNWKTKVLIGGRVFIFLVLLVILLLLLLMLEFDLVRLIQAMPRSNIKLFSLGFMIALKVWILYISFKDILVFSYSLKIIIALH